MSLWSSSSCQALCDSSPKGSYKQDPCTLASCNKCLLLSLLVQSSYSSTQIKSPIYEREGNWTELTFAKTSAIVTIAASSVTIPETIAGRISAPVPFSLLKWRRNLNQLTAPDRLVTICSVYNISFTSLYAWTGLKNCLGIFQGMVWSSATQPVLVSSRNGKSVAWRH